MIDYIILFVSWVLYFFIHSVLASDHVKGQFISKKFITARKYRMMYSIVSTIGLFAILILQLYLPSTHIFATSSISRFIGLVLAVCGIIILKRSFQLISMKSFLGVKDEPNLKMVQNGIHKMVRHPIYSGTILLVIGAVIFVPSDLMIISALSIIAYLPVGIMFEEEKLVNTYGQEYIAYKKITPAIFPKISSIFGI